MINSCDNYLDTYRFGQRKWLGIGSRTNERKWRAGSEALNVTPKWNKDLIERNHSHPGRKHYA